MMPIWPAVIAPLLVTETSPYRAGPAEPELSHDPAWMP